MEAKKTRFSVEVRVDGVVLVTFDQDGSMLIRNDHGDQKTAVILLKGLATLIENLDAAVADGAVVKRADVCNLVIPDGGRSFEE